MMYIYPPFYSVKSLNFTEFFWRVRFSVFLIYQTRRAYLIFLTRFLYNPFDIIYLTSFSARPQKNWVLLQWYLNICYSWKQSSYHSLSAVTLRSSWLSLKSNPRKERKGCYFSLQDLRNTKNGDLHNSAFACRGEGHNKGNGLSWFT